MYLPSSVVQRFSPSNPLPRNAPSSHFAGSLFHTMSWRDRNFAQSIDSFTSARAEPAVIPAAAANATAAERTGQFSQNITYGPLSLPYLSPVLATNFSHAFLSLM